MTALAEPPKDEETERKPIPVPYQIQDRTRRGRAAMRKDAAVRRMCMKFWKGEHYWYLNEKGNLRNLSTALIDTSGGKPAHRIRNTYNFASSIVEGKVSAASQRVPGYEVDPSSSDADDISAAHLAEQVAIYGWDKWYLRRHTEKVITNAIVQREGFVVPYYDPSIGPYKQGPDGPKGLGEIRLLNLSRSEVMWEPGVDFLESRWHAIERAVLVEDIKRIPGYVGGTLSKDASTADLPTEKVSGEMGILTEYLERPCERYPNGRRCFIASDRVVVDYRLDPSAPEGADWYEPYPYMDSQGEVCDEPIIHRLSYTVNPEGDDMGLVERLIDLQRTINDCWNKLLEWKNRCLNPQWKAPRNSLVGQTNDIPGYVNYYNPQGVNQPEVIPNPAIPRELFEILNMAIEQMRQLAADVDVQADPGLAAKTANAAIEQSRARWQSFLGDLAEFHSRLMRHCLTLVTRFYTEQRINDVRGTYGWEDSKAFTGMDLRSQVNVRVLPGSIETKTRGQVKDDVQFIQTLWPGAISPEAAMAAIDGGSAEGLIKSYLLDVRKANDLVQKLRQGPQAMLQFKPRFDQVLGDPAQGFMVPGWMPRKQDNAAIWKQIIGDYTKTPDYDAQPAEVQQMFDLVYSGLEYQEQLKQQKLQMAEMNAAAAQGGANAAKPQGAIAMPQQQDMSAQQSAALS